MEKKNRGANFIPTIIESFIKSIYLTKDREKTEIKKMKKKKFDGKIRCKDKHKIKMNNLVAQYVEDAGMTNKAALILDSAELLTTRTLQTIGVKHIDIPNPFEDYKKIKKKHRATYEMLLSEFLDSLKGISKIRHTYGLAWFDYCDTYDGNKKDNYTKEEDIRKYFRLKLPAKNSIFAITLSFRSKNSPGLYGDVTRCDSAITNFARINGYNACKIDGQSYNGMFVLFYKIY